jgi:hypothetical protein
MVHITIKEPGSFRCIALKKKDIIDFCADIIKAMNEIG